MKFPKLRRGATGQEYALIVGLIAVVGIVAVTRLGGGVNVLMGRTANTLSSAQNSTGASGGGGGGAPADGCAGSPSIGDVCGDGTVYAGLTPDGDVKMFVTRCDHGQSWDGSACTGTRSAYVFGPSGITTLASCEFDNSTASCRTGAANTAALAAITGHDAATACANLVANGHSDWYLPARNELAVIRAAADTGALAGTFDNADGFPSGYLWTSSETDSDNALYWRWLLTVPFNHTAAFKSNALTVRCARHD